MNALTTFAQSVEAALPTWPERLAEVTERFRELVASDVIPLRLVAELEAIAATPTRIPSMTASLHAWILWLPSERTPGDARGARLTIARIAAGAGDDAGFLTDSPALQLMAPLGRESIEADLYGQVRAADPEVMSRECTLDLRRRIVVASGDVLTLRPRIDVLDILPQPEARHVLIFDGPRAYTQQWVYGRADLRPVSAVAADPHDARLESGMRFLSVLGHDAGVPALAQLAAHDAHFVRWSAIRHTMALDPDEGFRLLEAAADDPHPHVRNAARAALERAAAG